MVREVKIQTEKGGQRKKNDLKEKTEFQTKKGLQNKQERTSHVEPISL